MHAAVRKASLVAAITILCSGPLALAQGNSDGRGPGDLPGVVGKGSLTIAGDGYWHRQELDNGDFPSISAFGGNGESLPDGVYRYEFRTFPGNANAASKRQGSFDRAEGKGLERAAKKSDVVKTLSGQFLIQDGQVIFG